MSGWPVFVDATAAGAAMRLLEHTASVVGCALAVVVWEAEEEPWVYVAESGAKEPAVRKFHRTRWSVVLQSLTGIRFRLQGHLQIEHDHVAAISTQVVLQPPN